MCCGVYIILQHNNNGSFELENNRVALCSTCICLRFVLFHEYSTYAQHCLLLDSTDLAGYSSLKKGRLGIG